MNQELSQGALPERTPIVGRETEQAELLRLLDQAIRGRGAVVLLSGEPGVGKTRLAEEQMVEARGRGMTALIGRCYETEGALPYIPFVEMLEEAVRTFPPEALQEALGDSAPEVAKLMPELRRTFPDIPPPPELPPEQGRRYLYNGVRDFIARSGRAQPLLLVLDDLHCADEPTLLLLQHIAQHLAEIPVLIIGTFRDVELEIGRPFAKALEDFVRQRLAQRIALGRLPEAAVGTMLRTLSGQEPPAALVHFVFSQTEGNPFFVEEVFRHLAEEGRLFDDQGCWRTDLEASGLTVPESVRLVIGRRLDRVSEETRRVLTAGAVVGRAFSFELLEAITSVDPERLLDAIDEAERVRLIMSTPDGPEARFTFAHELIRQTLIGDFSLPRRQRLHARVAEAMERLYARTLEEHAGDLAYHLQQAGSAAHPEKTVRYLTMAGDRAMESAAFEDALRLYGSALSLQSPSDERGRVGLLFSRAKTRSALAQWDDAAADWREALAIYEQIEDTQAVGITYLELAQPLLVGERSGESREFIRRGLEAVGGRVSATRCRLLAAAGVSTGWGLDRQAGIDLLRQAEDMAAELGDDRLLGEVLTNKASLHHPYLEPQAEADDGLRAADLLRSVGDLHTASLALAFAQWGLIGIGRLEEAAQAGESAESLATRVGHVGARFLAGLQIRIREFAALGNPRLSEERFQELIELGKSVEHSGVCFGYTHKARAQFWGGRWDEALENAGKGAAVEMPGATAGYCWGPLLLYSAYAGERQQASGILHERRHLLPSPEQPNTMGAWAMLESAIEALATLGEREEAALLYPLAREAVDSGAIIRVSGAGLFQTLAGMAASCDEQWEKAEQHYEDALRQAHEIPHKIEQPEVRRWYARMLVDRDAPDDREKASRLLSEAIAMYSELGMPKHVEMSEALLDDVTARPATQVYPDGLTERELEVLRLIAAGKRNKEIAEELFISPNTVLRHVSNIFAKTGVANRAEAATYAARHGLVE